MTVCGLAVCDVAVRQDQRQGRRAVPWHGEQAAFGRQRVAALRHDRERLYRRVRVTPSRGKGVGGGFGKQPAQAAGRLNSGEGVVAAPLEKVTVGVKQLVMAVNQDAHRNAIEQHLFDHRRRRRVRFGEFRRLGFGATFVGDRHLFRAPQPRRQLLRQFAKGPALDRTQNRRHFGLSRGGRTKRHHIG